MSGHSTIFQKIAYSANFGHNGGKTTMSEKGRVSFSESHRLGLCGSEVKTCLHWSAYRTNWSPRVHLLLLVFVVKFVLDTRMIHLYLGDPMARYLNGDLGSIASQDQLHIILMFRLFRLSNKAKTKSFKLRPYYPKGVYWNIEN